MITAAHISDYNDRDNLKRIYTNQLHLVRWKEIPDLLASVDKRKGGGKTSGSSLSEHLITLEESESGHKWCNQQMIVRSLLEKVSFIHIKGQ